MMNVKFSKYERVAGLFVGFAILSFCVFAISVAIKQGWFESKVHYETKFANADGVHAGTGVQMAGLRAGAVESVELLEDSQILVKFYILSKYAPRLKSDSVAQLVRPFVIGERVLELTVGSADSEKLAPGVVIASRESVDLMTILSGRELGNYLHAMDGMMENFRFVAEAFLDKDRTRSFVKTFDRIDPLVQNLNSMSIEVVRLTKQLNKNDNLEQTLIELQQMSKELNQIIPIMTPALKEVAPELPFASRRALEALDEAVVLIKAMQKNFFVRGAAEDVRNEEAKRKPTATPEPQK